MRKSTVRSGIRLLLVSMLLILLVSFYHDGIAGLLSLAPGATHSLYGRMIFWSSALGGLGVIVAVTGLIRSPGKFDEKIRIYPLLLLMLAIIAFYFYLITSSFSSPARYERLRPGETITI